MGPSGRVSGTDARHAARGTPGQPAARPSQKASAHALQRSPVPVDLITVNHGQGRRQRQRQGQEDKVAVIPGGLTAEEKDRRMRQRPSSTSRNQGRGKVRHAARSASSSLLLDRGKKKGGGQEG